MKHTLMTATIVAGLSVVPASATGLLGGGTSVDAGVSIGGTSVSASVGLGGGSLASVDVGIGSGGGGGGSLASVDVGIGGGTGSGPTNPNDPTGATAGPAGTSQSAEERRKLIRKALIGQPIIASDNVVLGTIVDVRATERACPTFGVKPSRSLAVDHPRVWLQSNGCSMDKSAVRVSMASTTFISQTR